ncbi:MAG: hypothetical protein M1821_006009 [Bathelium mastoideum]|nr:MAG: hypothetical protein M1821_006009 [Bathelium mastoideum]KAI9688455.1 MAG: hypothetical protein M1822_001404 [Bathelium mastoideum]
MTDAPKERLPASSSRPEPVHRPTQRLPAPSLFVGPPSRNASSTSLLLSTTTTQPSTSTPTGGHTSSSTSTALPSTSHLSSPPPRPTLSHTSSAYLSDTPPHHHRPTLDPAGAAAPAPPFRPRDAVKAPTITTTAAAATKLKRDTRDATEAQWREMQSTLEEVELSAGSGAHAFGPGHAEKLEALRRAQVELARAWARGEGGEEEVVRTGGGLGEEQPQHEGKGKGKGATGEEAAQGKAGGKAGRERGGSAGSAGGEDGGGRSQLEEEAEADIVLARRRREANDRYFRRVNAGVLDVVAKLDEVANAMKGVEMESKEIWGERDSIDTGSVMS